MLDKVPWLPLMGRGAGEDYRMVGGRKGGGPPSSRHGARVWGGVGKGGEIPSVPQGVAPAGHRLFPLSSGGVGLGGCGVCLAAGE